MVADEENTRERKDVKLLVTVELHQNGRLLAHQLVFSLERASVPDKPAVGG